MEMETKDIEKVIDDLLEEATRYPKVTEKLLEMKTRLDSLTREDLELILYLVPRIVIKMSYLTKLQIEREIRNMKGEK